MSNKSSKTSFILGLVISISVLSVAGFFVFSAIKSPAGQPGQVLGVDFDGDKGETVSLVNGQISLDANIFNDGLAHFYNTQLSNGKTVFFFVVKDSNGIYRAAANACQVCYDSRMGFRQEGDYMVCNTCGNKYPLARIATEKGGCNPGPINPNLQVAGGKVIIKQSDIEQIASFF